jgi:hypothetical protein
MDWIHLTLQISVTLAALALSILLHEYGHLVSLREKNPREKVVLEDGDPTMGEETIHQLSPREQASIYLAGIITGAIPLIPLALLVDTYWSLSALTLYLLGCGHDFKELWKIKWWKDGT